MSSSPIVCGGGDDGWELIADYDEVLRVAS